ncbi:unnamed protein product, partial [Laminaria digitata]
YSVLVSVLACCSRIRFFFNDTATTEIYTNVVFTKGGSNGGTFIKKVPTLHIMEEGGPMGAWPKGLEPNEDELVISKQYPSAFFGTSLSSTLTAAGIDTLILTGLTTSGCIRATCIDTVSYGFRPMVVAEACGDRDERPHEANLFDMNAKYADVVSEKETIDYLTRIGNQAQAAE